MANYEKFLISNFKTAKSIGLEPWLSPEDAFPTIINAHVNKGVLEKRNGFSAFATMKHGTTTQTATTITGIHTYLKEGMPQLLIFDTKRVNKYNPVPSTPTMTDITGGSDIFSGSASDFFHFCNWQGVGYMVNNVNQIYKYTGSGNVAVFNIQIDTRTKTNHIDTCRFIFVKDDRLLLFDTVEFGDYKPQRCRYSPVRDTVFKNSGGGYVDAPTEQRICAAGFVGDDIAVYFQGKERHSGGSLWHLRSTNNTDTPFKWKRITETEGCRSPYSGVEFKDGLGVIGISNVLFYDGYKIKDLDMPHLRDVLSEFESDYIRSVFGYNQGEARHILWVMTNADDSSPNRILDYNVNENNFTIHKSGQTFFANCFGGFNGQKVPSVVELDDAYLTDESLVSAMTVDSRAVLGSPSPYTLVGCRNSQVYKWNDGTYDGTDDSNGKIELDARSSRWNPYIKESRKARFGKIQFLVDNDSDASATVSFYKDTGTTAYLTGTLSCDGEGDKFWTTLSADGNIGNFHRIKISHTEKGNRPRIHAIKLYMKRAGWMDL
jgi:hypothetical protein